MKGDVVGAPRTQMQVASDPEAVATTLIDSILTVHRALGPGLLESSYQACLAHELIARGCRVRCAVAIPLQYGDISLDVGYRLDMLIEDVVVVENKVVEVLAPIHTAQLLTYLKLTRVRLGFLVNWNVARIKDGIRRVVCDPPRP